MKPAPFAYAAPRSLDEALALLARHAGDAKVIAGGQSLLPVLNFRLAQPAVLIDLNAVRELAFLAAGEGGLHMGALTRHHALEREPLVRAHAPLLAEAVHHIAHPQIRNRGTVGGSLAHADPKAELPALAVALGARFRLQRQGGERWLDAADFYTGLFSTALEPDELLTEIVWPPLPPQSGWAFEEVARRHGDYAQVGLAAVVGLDGGRCSHARLVFFAVGPGPLEALDAAAILVGQAPSEEVIAAAAVAAAGATEPSDDVHASAAFKRHLAGVLVGRALRRAFARARGDVAATAATSAAASSARAAVSAPATTSGAEASEPASAVAVTVRVNGFDHTHTVEPRLLLSDFLRHHLGLTGTHVGCEHGVCGACTVLLDGEPVRSCLLLAPQAAGHEVTTVEGLGGGPERLHPLQEAFWDAHALQCGFCTPGILMTLVAFLRDNPLPDEDAVRLALSGNLCRCTGYQHIVDAVLLAAQRGVAVSAATQSPAAASPPLAGSPTR